ncbi:MAG: hypothetical protein A2915_00240 [Candidatus Yanofskybacteria bacterium RIFCSPLOWO2_01_FULL_41_34]|uniref:Uncharacterized protein n=1 Tax=Candidatus Yanofskybacteria bacterium RIFCSPHIGHO2_01_FULL_41_26 TaxID=1802661 RepID=A0A1F8EEG7_9BACT|nr:MAG: hypothetical protein A2649_02170 [Candidatus Yanofskybacteria bacterium RIFCSPHIGHO2_01_FULL_41_26]OGN21251.1 MAG: hypothetical protein A2915_00240 [Candidatus Yanofskybacteria bacterium RIFCSPLOWO2_01_FULL_41_34]
MALSELEPDVNRVEIAALRMKEIIETTWLRDPVLNEVEIVEFNRLKAEIENVGLYVNWEVRFKIDDSGDPKIEADVNVLIPKNTTIH